MVEPFPIVLRQIMSLPPFRNFSTNLTNEANSESDLLSLNSIMGVFFLIFYISVSLTSFVGNSLVLLICCRSLRRKQRSDSTREHFFSLYIANLAFSDLVFTMLTFFDALYAMQGEWKTGNFTCKIQGFLVETCYTVSILTLVAISRERVTTVSRAEVNSRVQKGKERKIVTMILWIVSILACTPLLYAYSTFFDVKDGVWQCRNKTWGNTGRQVYYSIAALPLFIFPLIFMTYTHLRINKVLKSQVAPSEHMLKAIRSRQRKASRMLGMVTLLFFVLWSPFILLRTLRYFSWYKGLNLWKLSQLLVIASSATNPFVYCFYSTQFRGYFKTVLTCRCTRFVAGTTTEGTTTISNSVVN
ncbi:QRFP-like peptide receptor [Actinia tenebrosa]|uniref:QRFP-like peptide receptor n=1 Tax=Actinia tenebrosa TaxID=6105 RepID=A0A6P8J1B8_ACTTE|nr:QRFP-like peptide receptor [Actinia tenebrosa]